MNKLVNGQLVALTAAEIEALEESSARAAAKEAENAARWLSRVEFLSRFTADQRAAIYAERVNDPVIDDLLMHLSVNETIDKQHSLLLQGMDYLVSQGFITGEDKAVILA